MRIQDVVLMEEEKKLQIYEKEVKTTSLMTITVIIGYSLQSLPIYIITSVTVKKRRDFYFVIVGLKLRIHQYE